MAVEHVNYSDTLRQGTDKINAAIDQSNEAITTANDAKSTADQALANSENTQTQLNTIVINGDSSVEAAQARVAADGTTFTTLKDRLDNSDAQLTEAIDKTQGIVTPKKFGAVGDGTTDDSAALQNFFNFVGSNNVIGIMDKEYFIESPITIKGSPKLLCTNASSIIAGDMKSAVFIGAEENIVIDANINNLTVKRYINDLTKYSEGVVYRNVISSTFINIEVSDFLYNEYLNPVDGCAVAYNTFINPYIHRGNRNTFIYPVGSGYCNENNWIGGRWQTTSTIGNNFLNHIRIDQDPAATASVPNHNRFFNPSLEGAPISSGVGGQNAIRVLKGSYNVFHYPRTEGFWTEPHISLRAGTSNNLVTLIRQDTTFEIFGTNNIVAYPYKKYNEKGQIYQLDTDGNLKIKGTLTENATF